MDGYVTNIERYTLANEDYRRVFYTSPNPQLVLMTLQPGDEISDPVEAGVGVAVLNWERHTLKDGSAVVIPVGVNHNICNESVGTSLRL